MSARKLGLNTIIYGIGGMLNRVIAFLLLPVFTHLLSKEDFGAAGMLQIVSNFLVSAFSLGVSGSLSSCYYTAPSEEAKRSMVATSLLLLAVSAGVMMALLLPFSTEMSAALVDGKGGAGLFVVSLCTTALMIVIQPLMLSLQFREQSKLFVILSAATTLITAACNIVAVSWLRTGLFGWFVSQLIGQGIAFILYFIPFLRSGVVRFDPAILRRLLILGLPMMPCFFFIYIIQQGNRWMVDWFHGLGALGVYSLAMALATVSSLAVTAFQTSWTPYFMGYRHNLSEAGKAFGRVTTYYVYFMGMVVVCFFVFAQPVVEIMAGPDFHGAWTAIGSLAAANVLIGAVNLLTPAQYFSEKLGHLTIMQAIASVVSLLVNSSIIGLGGPGLAGLALGLSYAFLLVLHYWWNRRGISMQLAVEYDWKRISLVLSCVIAIAAVTLVWPASSISAGGMSLSGPMVGVLRGIAISGLFGGVIWIMLPPASRLFVISKLRRRSVATSR